MSDKERGKLGRAYDAVSGKIEQHTEQILVTVAAAGVTVAAGAGVKAAYSYVTAPKEAAVDIAMDALIDPIADSGNDVVASLFGGSVTLPFGK